MHIYAWFYIVFLTTKHNGHEEAQQFVMMDTVRLICW
jgi:hypothetical protein